MIQPDLRSIFRRIPRAPNTIDEVVNWAKNLVSALDGNEKDLYTKYSPDYASTLEFSPTLSNIFRITTVHAVGNCTINAKIGKPGPVWFIITNDATSGKVITFGTGFKPTGTLTGTASKSAVVAFISDGVNLFEVSRTTGL